MSASAASGWDICHLRDKGPPRLSSPSTDSDFLTVEFQPAAFVFQKCSALLHRVMTDLKSDSRQKTFIERSRDRYSNKTNQI